MDAVKRLLGFTNCHGERLVDNRTLQACLTGHHLQYLGYIFSDQPDSTEIQRAHSCLINRQRKPFIFTFADDTMIGIQEDDLSNVVQFMIHRVVFSCVDAKNQKTVVVFYHNAGNPNRDLRRSSLECHLMLGKSKEQARKFAERISDELIYTYQRRKKFNMIKEHQEATRTFANYVTYENWKPQQQKKISENVVTGNVFNGSTSTFSKSSCTTVASVDTEDQNCSSLWESLQDLDLPGESKDDPSSTPKPQFNNNIVQVLNKRSTTSRVTANHIEDINIDFDNNELSCLIGLNETDI